MKSDPYTKPASYMGEETEKVSALKVKFLAPIVAVIVLLILIITVSLFYFESENRNYELVHERLTQSHQLASDYYEKALELDVAAIRSIMSALRRDDKLSEIFVTYDREKILEYTQELYMELNQNYNITHFYFTGADRVNILRVHAPDRYGDVINRTSTLQAQKSQAVSYGVELGALGTFTLRVVMPWKNPKTGKLIGYIELGMEIDKVMEGLKDVFNMDVAVAIHKEYLDKQKWIEGMRVLSHNSNWDQLDHYVLSGGAITNIPRVLMQHLMKDTHVYNSRVHNLKTGDNSYWLLSIPLFDLRGLEIAKISMLADVSMEMSTAKNTAIVVGVTVSTLGFILIIFFWWQANRLGDRILRDEKALHKLATQDGLTGLYNRRTFDDLLNKELYRSQRFNHQLSLLMLDIDYFKKVNDTYGHQVGDKVLEILAKRVSDECRKVDYVCRYGGEEFIIILPETALDSAIKFAERLLETVSLLPFKIDNELAISITVSIGISNHPKHATSDVLLITAADKALYTAKKSGKNQVCSNDE